MQSVTVTKYLFVLYILCSSLLLRILYVIIRTMVGRLKRVRGAGEDPVANPGPVAVKSGCLFTHPFIF